MPENPVFDMDEVKKNSFHSDETVGGKSERGDVGTLVLGRRGLVLVGVFVVALCLFVGMLVYFLRPDCHSYHQSPAVSQDESVTMTSSAVGDVTTLRSYDPCLTSGQGCITGKF